MVLFTVIALAAIVVVEEDGAPPRESPTSVPRARTVVIDGTIEETEWRGSAVVKRRDGEMLLRHDGKYLYIGVRSTRRGFPSVCLMRGTTVRVLHASFALGDATYAKKNATWHLSAPFEWEPPARAAGSDRDPQRPRFLAERGWVGSTGPMGNPRHAEMQIALDQLDLRNLRISVALFLEDAGDAEKIASWSRARARDGCANERLVRGHAPERLTFRTSSWTYVRLK